MTAASGITQQTRERRGAEAPKDYWPDISHIQASDVGVRSEMFLRYVIIAGAGLALFNATGDHLYLAWLAAYLVTNIAYSIVLARRKAPVYLRCYLILLTMNMTTSGIYSVMPIYLWLTASDPGLKALALCGVFGHAVFNIARHTRITWITYWDTVAIIGSATIIGTSQVLATPNLAGQICVAFGAVALMVFYVQAQRATIGDREALARSRDEMLEVQKQSAMGQITAGVAHDFNNKLTVIQGNIELAKISEDPAQRIELLEEAERASRQAAVVVSHMQAFVRKSPLTLSGINLRAFCHDLTLAIEGYMPENIDFSVQLEETLGDIVCDRTLLRTALLNLALNARDAMEGSGGRIELRIAPALLENWSGKTPMASGPFIRFDISDEGPGLPVSEFQRVQEPFYTTKPKATGAGLGLSLVKGFAEQVGGALMLRNRVAGGLEVSLLLPQTAQE